MPFEKLVGDMGVSRAEVHDGHVHLIWSCRFERPRIRRHLVENVLGSWLQYARWIADTRLSPAAVWLEHSIPADTTLAQYEQFFECPVLFDQAYSALIVPLPYLQLPLRQADAHLLRTLEEHAQSLMATLEDASLEQRVKSTLRQLLKEGLPRKEQVAEHLAVSVRTLQRQLHQTGTSYQQILDELRQELAEHYLLNSTLPIQDIAQYLGFSESRSFHRAFKSRRGMPPGEFRHIHRVSNDG